MSTYNLSNHWLPFTANKALVADPPAVDER